ncbi:MAG: NADP-dependent malic enzyme [Bacteroidetes bacterium]|nr:NADP-dependent malic enzyme [Bacteroidota bacterium]
MAKVSKKNTLDYHSSGRPGKIEVIPTKPSNSQRDLSMAYSPGVADPCLEIARDPKQVYNYTAKGNLVAVISNGTAVLGLGDIGPEASKPVMEGKGVLFKIFADIDVFDIEINETDPEKFVEHVKAIAPTFGGINLEDIKAPESFYIEDRLKAELDIPVMHDDQHGTAIIASAGLLNASEVVHKKLGDLKVVFNGAGASASATAKLFMSLGVKAENLLMADSKGIINSRRNDLNEEKKFFVRDTEHNTLSEALVGADLFVGLSVGGILSQEMVRSMAKDPIVFALANPHPEINYKQAKQAREDIIIATGRSDHPNQVNNVLGFPFIFRGALDVRANKIIEEMKIAAARAIAELAKETVPEIVNLAYNESNLQFGRDYIIPKPFDPRLIVKVACAVAKAAMESGVAQEPIQDWAAYKEELLNRLGRDDKFIRLAQEKASKDPKRIVLAEGDELNTLKAAQIAVDEGLAHPILLGRKNRIEALIAEHSLEDISHLPIIDPYVPHERQELYAKMFFEKRARKGITLYDARKKMRDRNYYGVAMTESGDADAFISGTTRRYSEVIKPIIEIIGAREGVNRFAGLYIMLTKRGPMFFADTTVIPEPNSDDIVQITRLLAEGIRRVNLEPRIALLGYSNFGSSNDRTSKIMQEAREILHRENPELIVDGEVQANIALSQELLKENFPFSTLVDKKVNGFVFPDLASGNIAYKMLQSFEAAEALGPVLLGVNKPAHILQMGASVREIVNMITLASVDAQTRKPNLKPL